MGKEEYSTYFEQVYISNYARMKRFAREYLVYEEDAENVVHDLFLDILEKKEPLSRHTNIVSFLFTSLRNRCIDHLRRKIVEQQANSRLQEEHEITFRIKLDSLDALDDNLFSEETLESIISKAIDSLPEKCKDIFVKSKIEGKKQKEIAAELNISINTIENQMSIAYKKLRIALKNYLPLLIFFSELLTLAK